MKRFALLALVAGASLSFLTPSASAYECRFERYGVEDYGVDFGTTEVGVCFGPWCADLCGIEASPYCVTEESGTLVAKLCGAL